jgi:hypothetical protein
LAPFLSDALRQYRQAWEAATTVKNGGERYLPCCWALLLGQLNSKTIRVERLRFADNVRAHDAAVLVEFREVIVPSFGAAYTQKRRGFWCDSAQLLRITREAEAEGMEVLGSIHMHADVHRFWPDHARDQRLTERPTPMDEYLFRNTGWPLNIICHLESWDADIVHTVGAWAPPPFDRPEDVATQLTVRFDLGQLSHDNSTT